MWLPLTEGLKGRVRRHPAYGAWQRMKEDRALGRWARSAARETPPSVFKQHTVREYARRFGTRTLVETGTYLGEMVEAVASDFDQIYSIELDEALYRRAVARLGHLRHVILLRGDSGRLLAEVMPRIETACLFWLDAHYSGGVTARGVDNTPIRGELGHILAATRTEDVILIDDAHSFDGQNGYPTVEDLLALIQGGPPGVVAVAEDIIRITPRWP